MADPDVNCYALADGHGQRWGMSVLRCRPGDLVLVTCGEKNASKVTTCIALASDEELRAAAITNPPRYPVWRVDRPFGWVRKSQPRVLAFRVPFAPDSALMPIRPEPQPAEEPRRINHQPDGGLDPLRRWPSARSCDGARGAYATSPRDPRTLRFGV